MHTTRIRAFLTASLLAGLWPIANAQEEQWTGERIMQEVLRRHEQYPFVYEEQTMVLMDEDGNREVRQCRRFSRAEEDGTLKLLLVFDDPVEIRGVALLAVRSASGQTRSNVYLPAYGSELKRPALGRASTNFLGTDFAIEDLTAEDVSEFRYVRAADRVVEDTAFFVVEAYPKDTDAERSTGYGLRRHLVRKDIFFVSQTDFYDRRLRFVKRLTRHDLKRVHGDSWRANMTVVHDQREHHRSLLKVDRRVFSRDYVPAEMFSAEYLLAKRHMAGAEPPSRRASAADGDGGRTR